MCWRLPFKIPVPLHGWARVSSWQCIESAFALCPSQPVPCMVPFGPMSYNVYCPDLSRLDAENRYYHSLTSELRALGGTGTVPVADSTPPPLSESSTKWPDENKRSEHIVWTQCLRMVPREGIGGDGTTQQAVGRRISFSLQGLRSFAYHKIWLRRFRPNHGTSRRCRYNSTVLYSTR